MTQDVNKNGLPSPRELAQDAERQAREGRDDEIKAAIDIEADSILAQIRKQILANGYTIEFPIVWALNHDHVVQDDLWNLFWNSGWYIDRQKNVVTHVTAGGDGKEAKLPTYWELYTSIQEEIRASWDEEQSTRAEILALYAIAQLRKKILADGSQLDYRVKSDPSIHWLIFSDMKEILDGSGWFIHSNEPASTLKISAQHGFERKTDLPCQADLVKDAEKKLQGTQVDAEARVIAENLISQVREKMAAGANAWDYNVTVPAATNWYVLKRAEEMLDEAGWSTFLRLDSSTATLSEKGPRPFY